eukprot:TRINITY_DN9687_c0_g1_i1.p1 TRINITY_DN9687_c0_g1~~TRINITY_DN9687_c0_g1_i1.p1  ORF type:complete len:154 (-),score=26.40 TRINITY_DN9687_c0_g1_i1:822-1283(-)
MASEVDRSRWVCVYPVYLNSKRTVAQGRRIVLSSAVENPTLAELCGCCEYLRLCFHPEPDKGYSRDLMERGRLRVQLKKDDGTLANPFVPNRKTLFLKLAALVTKHVNRQGKKEGAPTQQLQQQAQVAQQTPSSSSSSTSTSEKKGKSGKKKK